MPKIIFSIFILFVAIPVFVFAQDISETKDEIKIGDATINYTKKHATVSGYLYFNDKKPPQLVASTHDIDGDNIIDIWLVYDSDEKAKSEAYDTQGDGEPDVFVDLDKDGNVINITGDEAQKFKRNEPITFSPAPISGTVVDNDLVGDLSDVTIKPKENNWVFFIILLIAGIALYFFWKRQK